MQNNKEAASSYVNHGFKLCLVRGKKSHFKINGNKTLLLILICLTYMELA